jgi:type II secretory pathway pseudopilin PulG
MSRSGFSVIEAVLGLAILGISAAAVTTLVAQNRQQAVQAETASAFDSVLQQSLERASSVPSVVGDGTQGFCRIIDTKARSAGLGYIYVSLPTSDPFAADWQREFDVTSTGPWEAVACQGAAGGIWQRCFRPKVGHFGITDTLKKLDPQFQFMIMPVQLRTADNKREGYTPLALGTESDARDTGLLVTARVTHAREAGAGIASRDRHALVWAGQVSCNKGSGASRLTLSASGIGSGTSEAGQLFSNVQRGQEVVVQGSNRVVVYTEGQVDSRDWRARTLVEPQNNKSYTAKAGCVESSFRCRQSSSARRWNDYIDSTLSVRYNRNNPITNGNGSVLRAQVSLALEGRQDGSRATPLDLKGTSFSIAGNVVGTVPFLLAEYSQDIVAKTPAANVCPNVCTASKNYNDTRLVQDPYVLAYRFDLTDYPGKKGQVKDPTSSLGCVCCYTKQCAAIGTRTKGFCADQPPEPLDARVPECAAEAVPSAPEFKERLPLAASSQMLLRNLSPRSCLAAKAERQGEVWKLVVEARPCDQALPALCFSQGTFVNTDAKVPFAGAPQACFDLARESVGQSELDQMLLSQFRDEGLLNWYRQNAMPRPVSGRYEFVNATLAGSFLAPQGEQIASAIALSGLRANQWTWIALRTDDQQRVLAAPIGMAPNPSPHLSFFDAQGDLYFVRDNSELPFSVAGPSEEGAAVLYHGRKFFGLVSARAQQPEGTAMAALCWDPQSGVFTRSSRTSGSATAAADLCRSEAKAFYAPTQPLQWTYALLLAKPNFPSLPFPNYLVRAPSGGQPAVVDEAISGALWVALKRDAGDSSPVAWKPAYRMPVFAAGTSSGHLMDPWGVAVSSGDPERALCRNSRNELVLRRGSCDRGESWGRPGDEFEEAFLLSELKRQNLLRDQVAIQIGDAPPPARQESESSSASDSQ